MAHEVFPTFPKSSLRLITVLRVIITINVCKKLVFTDTLNLDFFHPGSVIGTPWSMIGWPLLLPSFYYIQQWTLGCAGVGPAQSSQVLGFQNMTVEISILVGNNFRTWIKFPKLFKGLKTFLFSRRTLLDVDFASLVQFRPEGEWASIFLYGLLRLKYMQTFNTQLCIGVCKMTI